MRKLVIVVGILCFLSLGLAGAAELTFQQGAGSPAYTGCLDTWIQSGQGSQATNAALYIDNDGGGNATNQTLIRFQQVFVSEGGPIPDGSVIESATLTVRAIEKASANGGGMITRHAAGVERHRHVGHRHQPDTERRDPRRR